MTRQALPEPARAADLAAVRALLVASALPHEDLREGHLANFVVLRGESGVVGVAGIEPHGRDGLLRSVAVTAGARRHGHGQALVDACEAHARSRGITQLYLLTTTAADWFARRGYRRTDRSEAPAALQATPEFSALCPSSAVCMVKLLREP